MIVCLLLENRVIPSLVALHAPRGRLRVFSKTGKLAPFREIEMFLRKEGSDFQKAFDLPYFCQWILRSVNAIIRLIID